MAEPKKAQVLANLSNLASGALLALQMEDQGQTPLQAGKYIIINSGHLNAEGKPVKRAYSLFAVNAAKGLFFLAAETVAQGVVSNYLRNLKAQDTITFSGPWGKFHWPESATEPLVIAAAFGSGITAILGYLSGLPESCQVELFWYESQHPTFIADSVIRETLGERQHRVLRRSMQDDCLADLNILNMKHARFIAAGEGEEVDRWMNHLKQNSVPDERLQSDVFYRRIPG